MNRGEVWLMDLNPAVAGHPAMERLPGAENARLVVIISSNALALLPLRIIVPLTAWKTDFSSAPWLVRVPPVLNSGLEQIMAADALQVRSVAASRLKQRLGSLPEKIVAEISRAVSNVMQT